MVKLQIITLGNNLPAELQQIFPKSTEGAFAAPYYRIHTFKLNYLGDEHIIPLNRAYSVKQIVHWACEGESVFDYVSDITLN